MRLAFKLNLNIILRFSWIVYILEAGSMLSYSLAKDIQHWVVVADALV